MNRENNLKIANEKAELLAGVIKQKVEFIGNSILFEGSKKKQTHKVNYSISFMADELGKSSTYGHKFFEDIENYGFVVCMQTIDWIGKEVIHFITMKFVGDSK